MLYIDYSSQNDVSNKVPAGVQYLIAYLVHLYVFFSVQQYYARLTQLSIVCACHSNRRSQGKAGNLKNCRERQRILKIGRKVREIGIGSEKMIILLYDIFNVKEYK